MQVAAQRGFVEARRLLFRWQQLPGMRIRTAPSTNASMPRPNPSRPTETCIPRANSFPNPLGKKVQFEFMQEDKDCVISGVK